MIKNQYESSQLLKNMHARNLKENYQSEMNKINDNKFSFGETINNITEIEK